MAQQQVFVNAAEFGQRILRERENKCFVITPFHVIDNSSGNIEVFQQSGRVALAKIEKIYSSADLAILKVISGKLNCEKWVNTQNIQMMLDTQSQGFFRTREEDGSLSNFSVDITNIGEEYITVKPLNLEQSLSQGMSGSSLIINGVPIGILLSVEIETNTGIVIRRNTIDRLTEPFFKLPTSMSKVVNEKKQKIASNVISNIHCNDINCRIVLSKILEYKDIIKKVIFKSVDKSFERTIYVDDFNFYDENTKTGYNYIPIIPGNSKIEVFIEFRDGTFSNLYYKNALGDLPSKYYGKTLTLIQHPKKADIYRSFLGFNSKKGVENLFFQCETPLNTKAVLYSYDDGGYFRTTPSNLYGEQNTSLNFFEAKIPLNTTSLKLLFELKDGEEIGPYAYEVDGVEKIIKRAYKNIILETINNSIECFRVPSSEINIDKNKDGENSIEEYRQSSKAANRLSSALSIKGIPNEKNGPIIYCKPSSNLMFYDIIKYNFALKGIRFGPQRNNLNHFVPLNISFQDIVNSKSIHYREYYKIWHKKLPMELKEINFQYVFFDDTTSPIIRLIIEDL